jgi:hypothetical protein
MWGGYRWQSSVGQRLPRRGRWVGGRRQPPSRFPGEAFLARRASSGPRRPRRRCPTVPKRWQRARPPPPLARCTASVGPARSARFRTRLDVALAAAATAAVFSPRVRGVFRRGLVYGIAGGIVAARTVGGTAQTVGRAVTGVMPLGNGSSDSEHARGASRDRAAAARTSNGDTSAPASTRPARRPATGRAKPAPRRGTAARSSAASRALDA